MVHFRPCRRNLRHGALLPRQTWDSGVRVEVYDPLRAVDGLVGVAALALAEHVERHVQGVGVAGAHAIREQPVADLEEMK